MESILTEHKQGIGGIGSKVERLGLQFIISADIIDFLMIHQHGHLLDSLCQLQGLWCRRSPGSGLQLVVLKNENLEILDICVTHARCPGVDLRNGHSQFRHFLLASDCRL